MRPRWEGERSELASLSVLSAERRETPVLGLVASQDDIEQHRRDRRGSRCPGDCVLVPISRFA
jgi:hypothetical protein